MGFVKADWAHTKAVQILKEFPATHTSILNPIADALREAEANGYKRGKETVNKRKSTFHPGYIR